MGPSAQTSGLKPYYLRAWTLTLRVTRRAAEGSVFKVQGTGFRPGGGGGGVRLNGVSGLLDLEKVGAVSLWESGKG